MFIQMQTTIHDEECLLLKNGCEYDRKVDMVSSHVLLSANRTREPCSTPFDLVV